MEVSSSHFDCEVFQARLQCWVHTPQYSASCSLLSTSSLEIDFLPHCWWISPALVHLPNANGVSAPASRGPACCVGWRWDWEACTEAEWRHWALGRKRAGLGVQCYSVLQCRVSVSEILIANVPLCPLMMMVVVVMCMCLTWAFSALERKEFQDFSLFRYKKKYSTSHAPVWPIYSHYH